MRLHDYCGMLAREGWRRRKLESTTRPTADGRGEYGVRWCGLTCPPIPTPFGGQHEGRIGRMVGSDTRLVPRAARAYRQGCSDVAGSQGRE